MKGGKFVVIKLRELIKTAVFAVLGIIMIAGFIWFFLSMRNDGNHSELLEMQQYEQNRMQAMLETKSKLEATDMKRYQDGTYYTDIVTSQAEGKLKVKVFGGKISEIDLENDREEMMVFYPLLESVVEEVAREVIKNQSFDIQVSEQNAYSAYLILQSVANALEMAMI